MNDGISILVAVFLIFVVLRWTLGGQQSDQQRRQRRPASRRTHRVTPQMLETVRAMFPNIPTAAIQADLQRTGSVQTTVDNALRDGGLPLPATPTTSQPGSPSPNEDSSTSSSSTSRKITNYGSLIQRYKLDEQNLAQQDLTEPPKVWESDAQKRQEMLKKRKEFMVLQARKKLIEQQQQKTTEAPPPPTASDDSAPSKPVLNGNFDDLSVDELNTLTPEQRRLHMLQAFEKK